MSQTILKNIFLAVTWNFYPAFFGGTDWYKDAIQFFVTNSSFANRLQSAERDAIKKRAVLVARHLRRRPFSEVYCLLVEVLKEAEEEFQSTSMISDVSVILRSMGVQHDDSVDK